MLLLVARTTRGNAAAGCPLRILSAIPVAGVQSRNCAVQQVGPLLSDRLSRLTETVSTPADVSSMGARLVRRRLSSGRTETSVRFRWRRWTGRRVPCDRRLRPRASCLLDAFLVVAGANRHSAAAVAVATRRTGRPRTAFPTCFIFFARRFWPINAGDESSFPRRKTLVGTVPVQAAAVIAVLVFLSYPLQL